MNAQRWKSIPSPKEDKPRTTGAAAHQILPAIAALTIFLLWLLLQQVEGRAADGKFIKLESVIALPSSSISAAWSPDSKQILVDLPYGLPTGRQKSGVALVNIEDKSVETVDGNLENGLDDIVWSPDGRYIAIARLSNILLQEFPSLKLISKLNADPPATSQRCAFANREAVQFTKDSRHLWVACSVSPPSFSQRHSHLLMAVKLTVPDLKVAEELVIPNPRPTQRIWGRHYVVQQGEEIVLSSVLTFFAKKPSTEFEYVSCLLLEAKEPCFRPFQINGLRAGGSVIHAPAYSVDRRLGAVTTIGPRRGLDGIELPSRPVRLTLFRKTTQEPLSVLETGKGNRLNSMGSPTFSKNGEFLWAYASRPKARKKDPVRYLIGVWRTNDLRMVDLIDGVQPAWDSVSPDGSRLAIISSEKLHIYRFSESLFGLENSDASSDKASKPDQQ